jgi:acyl carrier protein
VLSPPHVRRALAALPGCVLINGYGPTENTTFTCCHVMTTPEEAGDPVPIGRPITDTRTYVLDDHGAPAPAGVWGELSAGGDGVARGYVGRPDLTAERFVPDPFGTDPRGARLYRTGDRARWRPDGRLEFGGRRDGQVKVRGFRVELGEVEAALAEHPAVRAAAVVLREDRPAELRLVGYVVPGDGLDGDLRAFLRARLPEPMVPAAIVRLPRLPLTANGKVDRGALPPPESPERPAERPFSPPSTPLEERLAEASAEVLGRERVSMNDNFFELGGHSLLATQLTARLRAKYGLEVPLELLFDAADFADLADRIVDRELAAVDDAALAELLGEVEPAEGDRA